MEFLRIIEIAISCQGDREESIRPDGNFEIRVEQASSAEIFQTEFEFFYLLGIRASMRTRGNSIRARVTISPPPLKNRPRSGR